MIQKITIEGYKSIKEQTVELFPINILIGGNGIGIWEKKKLIICPLTCFLRNAVRMLIIVLL